METDFRQAAADRILAATPAALDDFVRETLADDTGRAFSGLTVEVTEAFGLTGAGVSVADGAVLRTLAANCDRAAVLELIQERSGAGPCVDCRRAMRPVLVADITATRFPGWGAFTWTAANVGVVAVAALPISLRGTVFGVLSLYHHCPRDWTAEEVRTAGGLAVTAASAAFERHLARQSAV